MRFLFVAARNNTYDARLIEQLALPLAAARHYYSIIGPLERTPENVKGFDVAIEVNMARPEFLPHNCRHVAWVQDVLPEGEPTYSACARDGDLVYCLGDPVALGMQHGGDFYRGQLFTGVVPEALELPIIEPSVDFGIAGYVPEPFPSIWADYPAQIALIQEISDNFVPFSGELDILKISDAVQAKFFELIRGIPDAGGFWYRGGAWFKFLVREFPRMIERVAMANMAIGVSDNCEIRGLNWEKWPHYAKWVQGGHIANEWELMDFYRRCRINIHHNIHGLGMHSRVLEAMAAGGFIMCHDAPAKNMGRLSAYFEPDVHYGLFTAESFPERARYWLTNDAKRRTAAEMARKLVKDRHLWKHRTAQVLEGLDIKIEV